MHTIVINIFLGDGKNNQNPADFDWFDYQEDPNLPYIRSVGSEKTENNLETPAVVSATSSMINSLKH